MIASAYINGLLTGSFICLFIYIGYMAISEKAARRRADQRTARMSVSKASIRRVTENESEDGVFSPRVIIDPILRKSYDND